MSRRRKGQGGNRRDFGPEPRTVKVARGFNRPAHVVAPTTTEAEAVASSVRDAAVRQLRIWANRGGCA